MVAAGPPAQAVLTDVTPTDWCRHLGGGEDDPVRVETSDGVSVAVHDFGGDGPPFLISHATGFHAHCYVPIARALADEFHVWGHDHRGHGDTPFPGGTELEWNQYGRDTTAAAAAIAPDGGLIGFGHSMGGATLLMAALEHPSRFDLIVAFEPIVFPPRDEQPGDDPSAMITGARNRRADFDGVDAAIENYASKPPMQFFDPEVLRLYVEHGFEPTPDGGITLRCRPEHEARTFETGASHRLWDRLPEIGTRVVVLSGDVPEQRSPAGIAEEIADRLPDGSYVRLDGGNHLTPFIEPGRTIDRIRDAI